MGVASKGLDILNTTRIAEVMTRDVVSVDAEARLADVARLLADRTISGAPVVNRQGHAVGVISATDLMRAAPAGFGDTRVGEVMTSVAFTLESSASLGRAAALMAYEGIHRLPVTAPDGKVVGIVSMVDVVRWIAQQAGYPVPAGPGPRPAPDDATPAHG